MSVNEFLFKMSVLTLTNDACSFCYKPRVVDDRSGTEENEEQNHILKGFIKVVQRYLGKSFEGGKVDIVRNVKACSNCLVVLVSFCNLFHEMKTLELKVEWELRKLQNVMKSADEICSRVWAAEENSRSLEETGNVFESIKAFRKDLLRNCNEYFSTTLPRVSLIPVNPASVIVNKEVEETRATQLRPITLEVIHIVLGWISSLVAVFILGANALSFEEGLECPPVTDLDVDHNETISSLFAEQVPSVEPFGNVSEQDFVDDDDEDVKHGVIECLPENSARNGDELESGTGALLENVKQEQLEESESVANQVCESLFELQDDSAEVEKEIKDCTPDSLTEVNEQVSKSDDDLLTSNNKCRKKRRKLEIPSSTLPYKCLYCNVQFINYQKLRSHQRSVSHGLKKNKFLVQKTLVVPRKLKQTEKRNTSSTSLNQKQQQAEPLLTRSLRPRRARVTTSSHCENADDIDLESSSESDKNSDDDFHRSVSSEGSSCSEDDDDFDTGIKADQTKSSSTKALLKTSKIAHDGESEESSRDSSSSDDDEFSDGSINSDDDKVTFRCSFCGNECPDEISKKNHEQLCRTTSKPLPKGQRPPHQPRKKIICNVYSCQERFYFEEELTNHKKLHADFSCQFCDVVEKFAPEFSLHEMTHTAEKPLKFNCARCPYSTNCKFRYIDHHLERHLDLSRKPAQCFVCKAWFGETRYLRQHYQLHHNTENVDKSVIHRCDLCSAYFLNGRQLTKHKIKMHVDPKRIIATKNLRCAFSTCYTSFATSQDLENHSKLHGSFPCNFCKVVKTYAPDLAFHEADHSLGLPTKRKLKKTSKQKLWKCPRCVYETMNKTNFLEHHLETHLNLSWVTRRCPICSKRIVKAHGETRHQETYHNTEGLDPSSIEKCDKCPAYFITYRQLLSHRQQVHKLHPLICVDCDVQKFDEQLQWRKHRIRRHKIKESDFKVKCNVPECEEKFEEKYQLEWHMKNVHSTQGKMALCTECGKVMKAHALVPHMITHRKIPNEQSSSDSSDEDQPSGEWKQDVSSSCSDEDGTVQCSFCKTRFSGNDSLKKHEKLCRATGKRVANTPFVNPKRKLFCNVDSCQERFYFEEELTNHKKLHADFRCQFCDVVEKFAVDFSLHEMTHTAEKSLKFNCARCPYTSNRKFRYIDHHLERHLNLSRKPAQCFVCNQLFEETRNLRKHYQLHHNTENVDESALHKCDKCSAYFLTKSQLTKHRRKMHVGPRVVRKPTEKFKCNFMSCSLHFKTSEELNNHSKLHGSFPCKFCDVVETFAPDFAIHESIHSSGLPTQLKTKKKIWKCSRCPYETVKKANFLDHHLKAHLKLNLYTKSCPICGVRITKACPQRQHHEVYHNTEGMDPSSIQRCDKCPAFFRVYKQLLNHRHQVHKLHPLICVDCFPQRFDDQPRWRKHRIRKHKVKESDFKVKCNVSECEEKFEEEYQLEWHLKNVHSTQEKMAMCTECGKVVLSTALWGHMKTHKVGGGRKNDMSVVENRWICAECGKNCKSKYALDRHMLSHSGPASWQYVCLICEKRCLSEGKLMEHLRVHTREKPFSCEDCGEEYSHGHNLRNHKNKVHAANDIPRKRRKMI